MKKGIIEILSLFDKNKTIGEILTVLDKEIEIYQKQTQGSDSELVDLGLPSGNLWMTHNLGATSETDYGDYYQWGSLKGYQGEEALNHSTWKTCPFNDGKEIFDKKYFLKNKHDWFDKDNNLKPEYDAVTQMYGKGFKIPTDKDFYELLDNTISESIKNYRNSGKEGRLFTSKVNGKSIFIPLSGYVWEGSFYGISKKCYLWLGGLDSSCPDFAYDLYCNSYRAVLGCSWHCNSFAIRGIKVKRD